MSDTIDFGAQHFYVDIPVVPKTAVSSYDDYCFDGDETGKSRKA